MRLALSLLLANYLAFALFLALRPSAAEYLRAKDEAAQRGEFTLSDADPDTFIAGRPLYNWNEWHGGERLGVKVLEVVNLPALAAANRFTEARSADAGASSYYRDSNVRGRLFLLFATVQWLAVGGLISRWRAMRRRRG
jgi:hypothetical protein